MKKNKKSIHRVSTSVAFSIVILALFTTILGIEVITISYSANQESDLINNSSSFLLQTPKNGKYYDTSNLTFTSIVLTTNDTNIGNLCDNGCNISTMYNNNTYKFIIKKNTTTNEHTLDVVRDDKALFEDKELGSDINDLTLVQYKDLLVIKGTISENGYHYDNAIFINNQSYDEISSLDAYEIEFTDDGVIYYYDECGEVSKKIKALRMPFSEDVIKKSEEFKELLWCKR